MEQGYHGAPVPAITTIVVPPDLDGHRLDVFLTRVLPWRSRRDLTSRIRSGQFRINGQVPKKSLRVRSQDTIEYELPEAYSRPYDPGAIELRILHEDHSIVVVDKPAGVMVHPTATSPHDSLVDRLRYHYRVEVPDPDVVVHVVHRLDRETSGVLVFAKRREVAASLMGCFANRRVRKRYVAVVRGDPGPAGVVSRPLDTGSIPVRIDPRGKSARTGWRRVGTDEGWSRLEVEPHTGRKHQIRAHLAWLGAPVWGDAVYGVDGDRRGPGEAGRHLLHAAGLELRGEDGSLHIFEAAVPPCFDRPGSAAGTPADAGLARAARTEP